jgi:hypothetical protein
MRRSGGWADLAEERQMTNYLLSVYQPDGDPPPPEFLQPIMRDLDAWNDELRAAGAWVFTGGLHAPSTATVVRLRDGDVLTTDGPYAEGKEHLGGFTVIRAPDLDSALEWGRKLALITTLPIEVRPLHDEAED